MLFATDGNTDFCDDGNMACPPDAVAYLIQDMYTAGLGTVMVGSPTSIDAFSASALQNFANAGAGLTVALPAGITSTSSIYFQCSGVTAWHNLWSAVGRTANNPIATYGTTGGTAPIYGSSTTTPLLDQVKAAIASTKSCSFTLGGNLHVALDKLANAQVAISGTTLAQDATNGWSMASDTELVLHGTACTAWRTPTATISFQFPCEAIVFP